jgi:RNA polymerase sigma-70 factor (ECF subfamily)
MTVLDRATARLEAEFAAAGKSAIFAALKIFLTGDHAGAKYAEVAASARMSEGAARVAVHRLRDRFRAVLRTEIAQTLANPADPRTIDDELRYLLTVL